MSATRSASSACLGLRFACFLVLATGGVALVAPPARAQTDEPAVTEPSPDVAPPTGDEPVPEPEIEPSAVAETVEEEEEAGPEVTVGLGRGLTVRSADGDFSMTIRGRAQLRYEGVFDQLRGDTDGSSTFQARRVRLLLQGNLFGEDWLYYVQLGFSNRDTESDLRLPLRDAYMTYTGVRDLQVRFGQMKVPYGRQRVISSSALQFPDRTLATGEFNLDRDVGIQAFSTDLFGLGGRLGYNIGIFGGDGRNRTGRDFGMLYAARFTVTPFGNFDDFVEADHARREEPRLAVSFGGAINMNSTRSRSTFETPLTLGTFDFAHLGADAIFKFRGLSLQTEFFYRQVMGTRQYQDASDPLDVITETARTGIGYYAQAGYMFDEHFEAVARFGESRPRGSVSGLPREGEFGAGLNYYFQKHDFKIQLDYYLQYEGDLRESPGTEHHIRVQTQFYL